MHTLFSTLLTLALLPLPVIATAAVFGRVLPFGAEILNAYLSGGVLTLAALLGLCLMVALTA